MTRLATRMPVLFVGHGSPMTMITDGPDLHGMREAGARLPQPKAILCVSAHWQTQGQSHVTMGERPRTIHDFGGFPDELYQVQYPALGSDWLVERIEELAGSQIARDATWGFDHGVYGVVLPLLGRSDIPTVNFSLDRRLTPDQHLELAARLAPLRDEGVLILASGNVVHNLALWRAAMGTQPDWAVEFQSRINRAVVAGDLAALTRFAADDEAAAKAINSAEHYLPLLYAVGARLPGDEVAIFNDTVDGALSMTSYVIGG